MLAPWGKKSYDQPRQHNKKQRHACMAKPIQYCKVKIIIIIIKNHKKQKI